jgi:hypothetical protein
MLVACIVSGAAGLINPGRSTPGIAQVLPLWELYFWYGGLIAGGLVGTLALFSKTLTSIYIERISLTLIMGLCAAYGIALMAGGGYRFALAVLFVVAFGVACAFRLKQIGRDLRHLEIVLLRDDKEDQQ